MSMVYEVTENSITSGGFIYIVYNVQLAYRKINEI